MADVDIPAKMKPPHAVVTVLREIRPEVFEVSLGGRTVVKERSQLHRPLPVPIESQSQDSPTSISSGQAEQKPKR